MKYLDLIGYVQETIRMGNEIYTVRGDYYGGMMHDSKINAA